MTEQLSIAQTGVIGKTWPWQKALVIRQSGDACASLVENVDFAFFKA
ncbi:hypothetical protein [Aestuariivirga sp.]|nr:hypothetical protein [Aestuariivirga sp.]MCA3555269.1 hypothetical protein [Aestuariivirga sp.]